MIALQVKLQLMNGSSSKFKSQSVGSLHSFTTPAASSEFNHLFIIKPLSKQGASLKLLHLYLKMSKVISEVAHYSIVIMESVDDYIGKQ